MKTTRLCIGIISMILFVLIMFQSCTAIIGGALTDKASGASLGAILAWIMLFAGIIAVCTRHSIVGAYITAAFYVIASIISFCTIKTLFFDVAIWWGILSLIFAVVFICSGIYSTKKTITPTGNIPECSEEAKL